MILDKMEFELVILVRLYWDPYALEEILSSDGFQKLHFAFVLLKTRLASKYAFNSVPLSWRIGAVKFAPLFSSSIWP